MPTINLIIILQAIILTIHTTKPIPIIQIQAILAIIIVTTLIRIIPALIILLPVALFTIILTYKPLTIPLKNQIQPDQILIDLIDIIDSFI